MIQHKYFLTRENTVIAAKAAISESYSYRGRAADLHSYYPRDEIAS